MSNFCNKILYSSALLGGFFVIHDLILCLRETLRPDTYDMLVFDGANDLPGALKLMEKIETDLVVCGIISALAIACLWFLLYQVTQPSIPHRQRSAISLKCSAFFFVAAAIVSLVLEGWLIYTILELKGF